MTPVNVTVPSVQNGHVASVALAVALRIVGSVIVTSHVAIQPLASVTVNVCVPAASPVVEGDIV